MSALRLDVVTWNVHGFVGRDGRRDPGRVARVLRDLDPDVAALQEVDGGRAAADDPFRAFHASLGLHAVAGPTLRRDDGHFGNLLLSRHPLERVERAELTLPGREPRGVIDAGIAIGGRSVRILTTHLGLRRRERARQVRRLCQILDEGPESALSILLGDLNEWRPFGGGGLAPLRARFRHCTTHRTFPAWTPVLALDRLLVDRLEARVQARVVRSRSARMASDHLPLRATVELDSP